MGNKVSKKHDGLNSCQKRGLLVRERKMVERDFEGEIISKQACYFCLIQWLK